VIDADEVQRCHPEAVLDTSAEPAASNQVDRDWVGYLTERRIFTEAVHEIKIAFGAS
jgi:hypothetical protein